MHLTTTFVGISVSPKYGSGQGKEAVQNDYRKQCEIFKENKIDLAIGEVCEVTMILNNVDGYQKPPPSRAQLQLSVRYP